MLHAHRWTPAQFPLRQGDVRASPVRVVGGGWDVLQHRARGRHPPDQLGQPAHRDLLGVPDVDRTGVFTTGHRQQAAHRVRHVAQRSGLLPISGDGDGVASQRLGDEVRHHPSVVRAHVRAVGVEDARYPGGHALAVLVSRDQRFRVPLGFVVDRARPHRVDVPPVGLGLRVNLRVPVHLARRRVHEARDLGVAAALEDVRRRDDVCRDAGEAMWTTSSAGTSGTGSWEMSRSHQVNSGLCCSLRRFC